MTGSERNSDIVFAASYAMLLMNINSTHPRLVRFAAYIPFISLTHVWDVLDD